MKHYLIKVIGDVEPEIDGPMASNEEMLQAAIEHRKTDGDLHDGLFWLDIDENNVPVIGAFSGGDLDETEGE